jgi:hypothetical protein
MLAGRASHVEGASRDIVLEDFAGHVRQCVEAETGEADALWRELVILAGSPDGEAPVRSGLVDRAFIEAQLGPAEIWVGNSEAAVGMWRSILKLFNTSWGHRGEGGLWDEEGVGRMEVPGPVSAGVQVRMTRCTSEYIGQLPLVEAFLVRLSQAVPVESAVRGRWLPVAIPLCGMFAMPPGDHLFIRDCFGKLLGAWGLDEVGVTGAPAILLPPAPGRCIVLHSSPGLGKSCFFLYALRRLIAQPRDRAFGVMYARAGFGVMSVVLRPGVEWDSLFVSTDASPVCSLGDDSVPWIFLVDYLGWSSVSSFPLNRASVLVLLGTFRVLESLQRLSLRGTMYHLPCTRSPPGRLMNSRASQDLWLGGLLARQRPTLCFRDIVKWAIVRRTSRS